MKPQKGAGAAVLHWVAFILLSVFTLMSCGGGGGGGGGDQTTQNSDWDTMNWDQGNWR